MPYKWDLNIYRGCSHRCVYCYARYSHEFIGGNFFDDIYVKTNIVESLEKVISSKKWKKDVINIGSVCDSYQHIEKKYKIMPEILKLLIKYKSPAVISTKSDLILRDIDLINKLSENTYINIALSINCCDDNIIKITESGASSIKNRFNVIKEIKKTNASVGVHIMPVLPFITDSKYQIEELFSAIKSVNADYIIIDSLNLKGSTKIEYLNFIKNKYPNLFEKYLNLYKNGNIDLKYKKNLYLTINELKQKYNISTDYINIMKNKLSEFSYETGEQLSLF